MHFCTQSAIFKNADQSCWGHALKYQQVLGDYSATLSIDIFFATSDCCDQSLLLTGVVDALELVTLTLSHTLQYWTLS